MTNLPITHMTLYKHGVGFFERRAELSGEEVELSFRVTEMNDILKSLTVVDWGGAKVLGVDYATPQSREERLAGCSIRLNDRRSLRDLLIGLRGRRIQLITENAGNHTGKLLGLDEPAEKQPLTTALVSLLLDNKDVVHALSLEDITAVEILDERGASDLRFFLETALTQEEYRSVTIRLDPGDHDLSVSYIAPAPTWRISYRLLLEAGKMPTSTPTENTKALLLGWGIFDNRLEEDLKGLSLSLVAGMPISFVYDLYTPFTPERPIIKEEARVAAGLVEFEERMAFAEAEPGAVRAAGAFMGAVAKSAPRMRKALSIQDMAGAQSVETSGEALGELFQYVIQTPVTVRRGHSAMVPVVSTQLECKNDLIYNNRKIAGHPVATLRMQNKSGLTLERGPVTVLDRGEYVGEAVLPFTAAQGQIVVPYAVELGIKVSEVSDSRRELYHIGIKGKYLLVEEWDIRLRTYRASNKTGDPHQILIEHPRRALYKSFDTPSPAEETDDYVRYKLLIPAWGDSKLKIQEQRLVSRREDFKKQSFKGLQRYLTNDLIDQRTFNLISDLLKLYDTLEDYEDQLKKIKEKRESIYKAQKQIQGNMAALTQQGKERMLRARYVDKLEKTEKQLSDIQQQEQKLQKSIGQTKDDIQQQLNNMK